MPVTRKTASALGAIILMLALSSCAERPLVRGLFEPGGTIYREDEQEAWGSRSTVKVRGFDF